MVLTLVHVLRCYYFPPVAYKDATRRDRVNKVQRLSGLDLSSRHYPLCSLAQLATEG